MNLQELLAQIDAKDNEVRAIWDDVDAKQNGVPTEDQIGRVKHLNKEIEDLDKRASDMKGADDLRKQSDAARARRSAPAGGMVFPGAKEQPGKDAHRLGARKTLGEIFVADESYRTWWKAVAPSGQVNEKVRLTSPAVSIPNFSLKALVTGAPDTSAGALVFNDVKPLVEMPFRPLTLRDIITIGQTDSDTVEYPRVTGYTNAAAPTVEATSTAAGGIKPESAMALEKVTAPVKTIAHWIPATKRALSDAGQIRTLIDNFLRYGLEEELEDQIAAGDGTGENLTGIFNAAGTTAQAFDTNLLTTYRKARTKVRTVGRAKPTAYLMSPDAWQTVDLLQDNENRYFFGGPRELAQPRMWGLPVVECEAVPVNTAMVGDFRQVVLWDREAASIQTTDSHSDFFIRNMVAILAEMRAALGILRPGALVEVALV